MENSHVFTPERDFFVDNLLVRIYVITYIFVPLLFDFPFPGSLTSTLLVFTQPTGVPRPQENAQPPRNPLGP